MRLSQIFAIAILCTFQFSFALAQENPRFKANGQTNPIVRLFQLETQHSNLTSEDVEEAKQIVSANPNLQRQGGRIVAKYNKQQEAQKSEDDAQKEIARDAPEGCTKSIADDKEMSESVQKKDDMGQIIGLAQAGSIADACKRLLELNDRFEQDRVDVLACATKIEGMQSPSKTMTNLRELLIARAGQIYGAEQAFRRYADEQHCE